jgi:hypothetical protein
VGHVQPKGGVIDRKVVLVGTVSERSTLLAVFGPPFVTVIV